MKDVTIIEKIMCSMSPKFNYVVCAIEEANDIETMSLDELQSSLLVHEQKITSHDNSKEEKAATNSDSSSWRGSTHDRGRGRGRTRGRGTHYFSSRGNYNSNFRNHDSSNSGSHDINYRGKDRDTTKGPSQCFMDAARAAVSGLQACTPTFGRGCW
ncbi:unnamed protein product [Rhodiola kirilowii]